MKPITLLLIAVMASLCAFSQTNFNARKTSTFNGAIESVLSDFPSNFHNISGSLMYSMASAEYYESEARIPGAEKCTIMQYRSVEDSSASWNAKMVATDDFKKAAAQYKNLYKQLKGCNLRLVDGSVIYVSGEYQAPKESDDFIMSTLHLNTGDQRYKEVKIDLELLYQFPEWVININIGSKKKDSLDGYATPNVR